MPKRRVEQPKGSKSLTPDQALIADLDLSLREVADVLKVKHSSVSHGISRVSKPDTERRGSYVSDFLNLDRLIRLWDFFRTNVDANKDDKVSRDRMNKLYQEIIRRHPRIESLHPYQMVLKDVSDFSFDEAWVFSAQPFEIVDSHFADKMEVHLRDPKRRLVYFVGEQNTAVDLKFALSASVGGENFLQEVYIIVTTAVFMSPHWCMIFRNGLAPWAAVKPDYQDDDTTHLVQLPKADRHPVFSLLKRAGMLDRNNRFQLPSARRVGGEACFTPIFEIFYPMP